MKRLRRILDSRIFWLVVSLLASLAIWIYVTSGETDDFKTTFRNVRIEVVGEDTLRSSRNLIVTDLNTNTITVEITGPRRVVAPLDSEDLVAQVDVSKLTRAAYTTLKYDIVYPSSVDERYITEELKQYEDKILGAEDKILALETRLFAELVTYLQQYMQQLQRNAQLVAEIDCLLSFAKTAVEHRYVRPVVDDSHTIDIKQGRHPVIEANMPVGEQYVPNDVYLNGNTNNQTTKQPNDQTTKQPDDQTTKQPDNQQIIIITGPNMAGKSALLRQTALIVLLAQIGCYVPADSAHIGLVDKIFTRVGASDSLSTGESTFMVEMTEAASILNNVTDRSLVLFDELGRGTSTYDGISIAWAIVEYLHEHSGSNARTLFATHYHELNEMEAHFPRIRNYNVSVKEINGKVIFLRKLVEGGSEHSFGIHVAQLAGMPPVIVKRANEVLAALEKEAASVGAAGKKETREALSDIAQQGGGAQLSFFQLDDPVLEQIRDEILAADINNLTPLEALNKLNEIKKLVGGK